MTNHNKKGGRKPSRRQMRYGKLVRGWDWRTTQDLLKRADLKSRQLGIGHTELLERALEKFLAE